MTSSSGIRIVAAFEAAKGCLVLLAGFGLLALVHHDAQAMAEQLVRRFHLNPASHYPRIFIDAAGAVTNSRLWLLASTALGYAAARIIEAYGLWRERRWAEWFAVATGAIYLPIEVYELFHRVTWAKVSLLVVNIAIVAYMSYALWQTTRQRDKKGLAR